MAIISFAKTTEEFLSGEKTVTRRAWADSHYEMWVRLWENNRVVHDAYDTSPRAGGKKIGQLRLTSMPYRERLADMPEEDLAAEGAMCATLDEYYRLIDKGPEDTVTVIRFKRIA
ncbi:MAG: hypothetical protein JXA97_01025 [Anaerolineales bacterium]|nr:hypothetical protein [Anaerolineales bacterium]